MPEEKSSRRGFLEVILGGGVLATLGSIFYPVAKYIMPPATAEADPSQLKLSFTKADIEAEPKKAKYFKYGRELGIIVVDDDGTLHALTATCTHLDCTVQNRPDWGVIWCSCHNGKYDLNGRNISGPPPNPLTPFKVKESGNEIFVSKENS